MADITVRVITPATSYALATVDEVKKMLGITSADTSEDEQLQIWIDHYSDVIATMCNRVFAKEKVEETWRGDSDPFDTQRGRVFLTHYPVKDDDVESVNAPDGSVIEVPNYILENRSGKIQFFSSWGEPIQIIYAGGYNLPDEAPFALKQALGLLVSAQRISGSRELTSGIRSISHRESRIQFFDTNQTASKTGQGSGPIAAVSQTVNALLYHYMRIYV